LQGLDHLRAGDAQGLGGTVKVEAMPTLVLHLGQQDRLASQRGRAGDPVAFRLHADHLGMSMLRYLADQVLAIGLGHPVLRLDLLLVLDALQKALLQFFFGHRPSSGFREYLYDTLQYHLFNYSVSLYSRLYRQV